MVMITLAMSSKIIDLLLHNYYYYYHHHIQSLLTIELNDDCRIDVKDLLAEGIRNGWSELPPRMYQVIAHKRYFKGEIEVGVSFQRQVMVHV